MTEERRARLWSLFDRAADLPPPEQRALLDAACPDDPDLRAAVEKLLADDARVRTAGGGTDFLKSPVARPLPTTDPLPAPAAAPAAWPRLERYRVVRLLGEGGMGAVYEAEQDSPRRAVALKVIRPGLVSPALLKRFAQEAQILGRLQHPGIAQIHEAGVAEDGQPFFAMEFVRGLPLDEYARRQGLDAAARLDLVARVCDSVQHAHERGIVHRDLKPSNILVDEAGQPKVLDFGVARAAGADLLTSALQTGTGQLIGTLSYMSPEQVVGDPRGLDGRSDVYALGVILFELLAGRLPYSLEGLPLPEAARVIREQEPARLGALDARLRGDVETIAARALEKDRARRYPSAAELAADVRRHLSGEPIRARRVGAAERLWSWARRRPALATAYALAGLVLFLGLGGGLAVWAWQTAEGLRQTAEGLRQSAEQAHGDAERARQAEAVAKAKLDRVLDLHRVQLAHREWLGNDVARARQLLDECAPERRYWEWYYVKRLSRPLLELSEPPGGITGVKTSSSVSGHFSPDGRRLVVVAADGAIVAWDAETGKALATLEGTAPPPFVPGQPVVASSSGPANVAFSPDGKVIAATRGTTVAIWDADTGKRLRVLGQQNKDVASCLAFGPDGHLALGAGASMAADTRVRVWDAETGREVFVLQGHKRNVTAVAFSPDGRWLASGSYDGAAKLWDARTGQEKFTLEGHTDEVHGVAFHPDGDRLATASTDGTVKVWGVDGKLQLTLPAGVGAHSVAYTPDGKRLVAGLDNGVVVLWDAAGKEAFSIRGHLGPRPVVSCLSFSPDGKRLASSGWDDTVKVWDATTPQEVRAIPLPLNGTYMVKLSARGRRLAESRYGGDVLVWEVGEQPRSVTLREKIRIVEFMAFSPDESRLAVVDRDFTLGLWDTRTGESLKRWKAHENWMWAVAFSPDGRLVATAGQSQGRGEVKVWDGDGRLLLNAGDHAPNVFSVGFSPDQKWLVSSDSGRTLKVRDAQTGKVRWEARGPADQTTFSPDGRWVAGAAGSEVRVWDAATGEELHTLDASSMAVQCVRFSPDGQRLITSTREGTIILWDVMTGVEALRLKGASGEVFFSADGARLFAAEAPGVKVWEAASAAGP